MLDTNALWVLVAAVLVFMMQGGFLCLEVGLVRAQNVTATAMKNVIDWTMVGLAFWFVGFGFMFGDDVGGWIGRSAFMLEGVDGTTFVGGAIFFIFQLGFAATAVTIVSGALAERVSFVSYLAASFLMAAVIYPLFGHWVWNADGWLARLGFVDFAGSMVVHGLGGVMALVGAAMIGPRLGRFSADGEVQPLASHSLALTVLGVTLLWVGWWGFNGGSTLALDDSVAPIIINTNLAASAGGLVGFLHARFVQRRFVTEKLAGGILGGLVAITASCNLVSMPAALLIGALAGVIHNLAFEALLRWRIDDPVGAVPVHLACGVFGVIGVALFAPADALAHSRWTQLAIQLTGAVTCIAWAGLASFGLFALLRATTGLRVSAAEERSGLRLDGFVEPVDEDDDLDPSVLEGMLGLSSDQANG